MGFGVLQSFRQAIHLVYIILNGGKNMGDFTFRIIFAAQYSGS
jgi:hypothetical protein